MADYKEGIKKEVAETKFLIHDLRVERFINEVIHFHVTLNTDLEIYNVDQAQILHSEDLQVLKANAVSLRKALQDYSNAVKSFSPDRTILLTGKKYIKTIHTICELILNPLWGRIDGVLRFLPDDSRSVRSRTHYRNCIHWIRGVHARIEHFLDEQKGEDVYEEFDLGYEIEDLTRNVIYGYVAEKSSARVELQLARLDSAVIGGSLPRFRRMFFNLIMNSVDAMRDMKLGVLNISDVVEGDRVVLKVRDNGAGMPPEKIKQLLTDKETLDGELHSLGFVFVRQAVGELKGDLSIESELGKGTTMTVSFPFLQGRKAAPRVPSRREKFDLGPEIESARRGVRVTRSGARGENAENAGESDGRAASGVGDGSVKSPPADDEKNSTCGRMIYRDYEISEAQFPGSIFAMSVTKEGRVDYLSHKPYERYFNMTHEDLSPMFFEATMRGRLEEDDQKVPVLVLKAPQNVRAYFEFKEVPEQERTADKHVQMVHDEYIWIARKLIDTGLPPRTGVYMTDVQKFFPGHDDLLKEEPFPLELLAKQALTSEEGA